MSGSRELTIEISGVTDISEDEIKVHFQKKKYGGGKVTVTSLEDDKAIITIEGITPEVHEKILEMKHVIDDQELSLKQIVQSPPTTESFTELPLLVNDSGTVVIRFQQLIHEDMIKQYFTNESLSGGGPIDKIVMKEKEAFIVFTDQATAIRVARKGHHVIVGHKVEVQLISSESATGEHLHAVIPANVLLVKGLHPQYHDKSILKLYFSNQIICGGGDIAEITINGTEAYITYADPTVAARVAEKRQHTLCSHEVEVHLVVSAPATGGLLNIITSNTILVKELNPPYHDQSVLELYFSNHKKCGGGDIAKILVKDNEAYITYAESGVAARVAEKKQHNLLGHKVEVQLVPAAPITESLIPQATTDTILVKGLNDSHNEPALRFFFTNKKKCGGGDVTKIVIKEENAYVTFADPKVAARVAEKKFYKIVGYSVEVVLFTGAVEDVTSDDPTSLVSDNVLILDNVPSSMSDDVLMLYIDSITELDGEQNDYSIDHDNAEVMITFNAKLDTHKFPAGLDDVVLAVSSKPYGNVVLQARRPMVLTNSILIDNLPKEKCNEEILDVYFTNKKKSGIDSYKKVEILDDNKAIVHLESKNDMLLLLDHDHSWLGSSVVVSECKAPIGISKFNSLPVSSKSMASKKVVSQNAFVIDVPKPLVNCLKKTQEEVEKQLSQLHAAIAIDTELEHVTINPSSGSEGLEDWETNCQSVLNSCLNSFVTETVSIPSEIKDVMLPIINSILQKQTSVHYEFDAKSLKVVIVGEKVMVDKVKERVEEACDSQMVKKESLPIEDYKFLSFLRVKLNELLTNHPKINATLETDENCVTILGIKDSRIAFKKDFESLHTEMVPVTVRISKDFVEFLSTSLGRTLLHQYLQGFESLVAVHFEPEGTLLLLCSRRGEGIKVAKIIQENVSSISIPYPQVFVSSLSGKEWATLKSDLEESYCVSVSSVGNKIQLIGDKKSLGHVGKEVQQFIERECNTEKSIPLCAAQWRLLTTHMLKKWSKIEQNLKSQSKIKFSLPNEEDKMPSIVLKGEKFLVAVYAKQVEDLISTMCTCPPLEQARPGTVKYFYSEKGRTLITGVEAQEKSCIQLDVQQGGGDDDDLLENGVTRAGSSKLCMGTTKEGKVITLVKGDITEISVDVIVNASNADLKHIGGVALAIANKGGPVIQEESNRHTRSNGKLSDGEAVMMKDVGKLPCKRLIHAVGPRWNGGSSKEEAFLKKACLESLKLARNFKTVSFPAISSGVFGFPINKCATCMIKAYMEYSKNDALSPLHEITIVVRDQSAIDAFASEMSHHLDNFRSTSSNFVVKINPKDSGLKHDFKPARNKRKKQNVQMVSKEYQSICAQFIKLYRGDLLKQTADVYVNTAGENLDLRQGAVAASFLKAGGQDLQDECTAYVRKNGKIRCGEVVVTRPGAIRCSRVIHTVGSVYNGKASEKALQDIVQKCLEACDKLRASTIAFPALGAGNLNYPQNVVADVMVNTIAAYLKANHTTTYIKTIKLVIFMDNTYVEFDKLLSSRPSVVGSSLVQEDPENLLPAEIYHRARVPRVPPKSATAYSGAAEVFTAGNLKVEIMHGDITEDDSDVIVNTTNAKMQLVGSGVAAAILRKGGPEMQTICDAVVSNGFQLQEGKVCDTPSTGNLKCKKVFHVVIPQDDKQLLSKTIGACLKRAEKLQLNSVAFPAIGTGILGYSLEEAAHGICSSIIAFGQKTNPVNVKRVRIIIFQKEMYQSFIDKFSEIANKPGILKRMGNAVLSWFTGDGSSEVVDEPLSGSNPSIGPVVLPHGPTSVSKITERSVLLIQIYAEDKQKVAKTEERLQRIIEEQFVNEKINNELIANLSQNQKDDLLRKAKQKHVQIIFEIGADLNYIQLKGDRTDVADLKFDIQEILRQISSVESTKREAKLLQAKVKWQWLNDNCDYEDYDELLNYYIEEAYQQDKTKPYTYRSEGVSEKFNFIKMEADDGEGVFKIKRVDIEDLLKEAEHPGKWDPMPQGVVCHVVTLDHKTTEYGEVKRKFEMTMQGQIPSGPPLQKSLQYNVASPNTYTGQYNQIIKIERIQNPFLHGQYVARKKTMDQQNPSGTMNERELFHGCPGDVVAKISHQGFNRSFAGKNATVYGKGVYFARDASYSARDQYSPRDANNNKFIFLAKVLTGEFTVGNSHCVTPPPKSVNSLTLYDSVVDNANNPSIFVIFGDAQAYPDYLITFT